MNNHGNDECGVELNDDSTFARVSPNCELHWMVLDGFDVFPFVESLLDFLVHDAIVPVEEEMEVGGCCED